MMINLTRQEIEAYFEELQTELDYSRYIVLNGKRDDHIHVAVNGIYAEDNTLKNREIKFTYNDSPISEQRFIELLENADTTDIFTQREMHRQYNSNEQNKPTFNVNTPTWSRVMSGDELKDYLGTLGIKQNHGYFILSESDNAAVGLNPTAPSPFVVWEKAQDGGYLSGQYGNNLDYYDSTDLSNLGIEKADAINILHDNGVLYTNAQSANEIIPTWSRIMSNDELVSHLENQGFKQNDGYFIIFENDVTAFAINPMLPDPFIKWDKTADGEYVNGIISNNINEHIQSYQRDYGMSLDSTLNILRESGILYTNKIFESSGMSYADIPPVNSAESINEASREQSQPIAEVQSDELEVHTPVIEQLLEKYPDAKMSDDNYTTSQVEFYGRIDVTTLKGELTESLYYNDEKTFNEAYTDFINSYGEINEFSCVQISKEEYLSYIDVEILSLKNYGQTYRLEMLDNKNREIVLGKYTEATKNEALELINKIVANAENGNANIKYTGENSRPNNIYLPKERQEQYRKYEDNNDIWFSQMSISVTSSEYDDGFYHGNFYEFTNTKTGKVSTYDNILDIDNLNHTGLRDVLKNIGITDEQITTFRDNYKGVFSDALYEADLHYNYNETKTNLIKSLTEPKDVFEKQSEIVSTIEQDKPSISNINLYTLDGDSEPKYSIVDQRGNDTLLKRTLSNEVSDPTPFIVATGLVVHDGNVIEWDSGKYCSNLSSAIKAFEPSLDNENSMKTVTEFIDDKVDYWHTHETNTGLQEFLGVNQTDFLYLTEKLGSEQLIKPVIDPSKKTVYVCSPLAGEISVNIAKAREYAKFVAEQGGTPIAPHVTEIFDDLIPAEREMGLAMGIDYLHKADELWVFGDRISSGMAAEIEIAQNELHIPVYQIPAPPYEINPYEKKEELNVAKYNTPRQNVTPEQIALAKQVDLLNYIQTSGFEVKPHGSGTYKLIDDGHDSTIIFPDGNSWFSYNDQVGGDSISFVQRHQNLGFVDAVKALVGEASNFKNIHIPARQTEIKKDMVLPPKDENNNRVFAYLIKTRGIDRDLVKDCIDNGLIYQSKEAIAKGDKSYNFNNCVFVGHDNDGKAQYASQRSMNDDKTVFKADVKNSSKEYGFALAGDDNAEWLTVCEAPIDALSIASMNKSNGDDNKNEHILSLGGVSDKAIDKFLENNDKIKVINICLDNDDAGHQAGNRIKSKYEDLGYKIIESYPKAKDYNLQLLQQRAREDKPNVDLPPPSADNKRVYMHLTQNKHLNKDVIAEMLKNGDIYQTTRQIPNSDKVIADTVFVQKDKDNNPVYGIGVSHNTNLEKADFKIEYQNDEKTSNYISREGNTDTLLVFSNPISMVTQMSIEKDLASINAKNQTHHMICALGKTDDAVLEYLSSHKNIKEVNVSLDTSTGINNKTQQPFDYRESMFNRISKKCATKTVKVSKKFPENKSLNQDYVNCKNKAAQKPQSKNQQSSHIKDDNSLENE